jgi:hypothetical protein
MLAFSGNSKALSLFNNGPAAPPLLLPLSLHANVVATLLNFSQFLPSVLSVQGFPILQTHSFAVSAVIITGPVYFDVLTAITHSSPAGAAEYIQEQHFPALEDLNRALLPHVFDAGPNSVRCLATRLGHADTSPFATPSLGL